jgi:hypothetical protein
MRRLIIIVVIVLLLCIVIGFGYEAYVSHQPDSVSMELRPPFARDQGNCWIVPLPDLAKWADNKKLPEYSTLVIYENGRALGPPHSVHDSIKTIGEGRFSHWKESLFFSTTDNSDPNQNHRQYSIKVYAPRYLLLFAWKITYGFLGLVLTGGVIGLALMVIFSHARPIRIWLIIAAVLNGIIIYVLGLNGISPLLWYGKTVHVLIFLLLLCSFASCFLLYHEIIGPGRVTGGRKLTFTIITIWSVLSIFVLMIEVFFRILPIYDTSCINPGVKFFWPDYVYYPVNNMGCRDRPFNVNKNPHTFRILAVGDSYTEGAGCRRDEAFPGVLEKELNRRLQAEGCSNRVEVYNLSQCGANTVEEVEVILKDAPLLKPDLILLAYVLNDPEVHPTDIKIFDPPDWVNVIHAIFIGDIHSYAYYWFFNKVTLFKGNLEVSPELDSYELAIHNIKYHGWLEAVQSLSNLRKFLDEKQWDFLAIIYPEFVYQSYPQEFRSIHRQVFHAMEKNGLAVIDLLNLFEGINKDMRVFAFSGYDRHPSVMAHNVLGRYLAGIVWDRESFAHFRNNCESKIQ